MFNFETRPTFYASLTNVQFSRLSHFLRNYKGAEMRRMYCFSGVIVVVGGGGVVNFFVFRSFSRKL